MAESEIGVFVADGSRMACELLGAALKSYRSQRFRLFFPVSFTIDDIATQIVASDASVAVIGANLASSPLAGFEVLRKLRTARKRISTVLLLDVCGRDLVVDAFRFGASGVLSRSESSENFPKCIYAVHRGEIWARNHEIRYALEALAERRPPRIVDAKGTNLLSPREEEVVRLVTDGLTNREISEQMNLSEHTVKNYLFHVYEKLGISTRVELIMYVLAREERRLARDGRGNDSHASIA